MEPVNDECNKNDYGDDASDRPRIDGIKNHPINRIVRPHEPCSLSAKEKGHRTRQSQIGDSLASKPHPYQPSLLGRDIIKITEDVGPARRGHAEPELDQY